MKSLNISDKARQAKRGRNPTQTFEVRASTLLLRRGRNRETQKSNWSDKLNADRPPGHLELLSLLIFPRIFRIVSSIHLLSLQQISHQRIYDGPLKLWLQGCYNKIIKLEVSFLIPSGRVAQLTFMLILWIFLPFMAVSAISAFSCSSKVTKQ